MIIHLAGAWHGSVLVDWPLSMSLLLLSILLQKPVSDFHMFHLLHSLSDQSADLYLHVGHPGPRLTAATISQPAPGPRPLPVILHKGEVFLKEKPGPCTSSVKDMLSESSIAGRLRSHTDAIWPTGSSHPDSTHPLCHQSQTSSPFQRRPDQVGGPRLSMAPPNFSRFQPGKFSPGEFYFPFQEAF